MPNYDSVVWDGTNWNPVDVTADKVSIVGSSVEKLSGSTDGKGIVVAATATPGTTIHTATAGAGDIDLVSLWAVNNDADGETRTLTIEWGAATAPDCNIIVSVPCKAGPVFVCDRLPIMNSLVVKAFADEASDVVIYGVVARIDK